MRRRARGEDLIDNRISFGALQRQTAMSMRKLSRLRPTSLDYPARGARRGVVFALAFAIVFSAGFAGEAQPLADDAPAPSTAPTVEQVAKAARPSIVVISVTGRDGNQMGLGS